MDQKQFQELTDILQSAYESSVTIDEAEKLAARFLHAQIQVAEELASLSLDARMRKSGVKAIRAAIYMQHATASERKPSDVLLEATVNMNDLVQGEQEAYDASEVQADRMQNYFNIFREAHIFFRGVSRGKFE